MKKRSNILLFIILIAALMIPAAVYADPPSGGCTTPSGRHEWQRNDNIKDPTCTESGTASYTCKNCGQQYTEEIPPAHKPETIYGRAATCVTSGLTNGQKCSVCDKVLVAQVFIPALGHDYVSTATGEPTCTDSGYVTYVCRRCGSSYTEEIPASWHDWDEGRVTREPQGFVPGLRLFTCKRDASHTMTEEINPAAALFAQVRGIPKNAGDAQKLTVSKQPAGGHISHDGYDSVTLTVEVSGGTAPYTYEWFCVPLGSGNSRGSAAVSKTDELFKSIYKDHGSWIKSTGDKLSKLLKEMEGVTLSETPFAEIQQSRASLGRFGLVTRRAGTESAKSFEAKTGDCSYYCVITDAAGRKVMSDAAEVRYKVYIAEQPHNENLKGLESVTLSCAGGGGRGGQYPDRFSYAWFDAKGNALANGNSRTVTVTAEGEYYCVVSDGAESAQTEKVQVYKADPLIAQQGTASMELRSVENVEIKANFSGGMPPYYVEWLLDGEPIETRKSGRTEFSLKVSDFGHYVCIVKDVNGNTAVSETRISVKQLNIEEQPTGGALAKNGAGFMLKITVSDGSSPYNYYLFRNGQQTDQTVRSSNKKSCSFTVTEPGEYQIVAEDYSGIRAYSDFAAVNDYEKIYINNYSEETGIDPSTGKAGLYVRVNGGKAPYTYTWEKRSIGKYGWISEAETLKTNVSSLEYDYLFADDFDSIYFCRIEDSAGDAVYAVNMRAVYKGDKPYFTVHPQDVKLEEDSIEDIVLRAWVLTGKDSDLPVKYRWQHLDGSRWVDCGTGYSLTLTGNAAGKYRCLASTDDFQTVTYSNSCMVSR